MLLETWRLWLGNRSRKRLLSVNILVDDTSSEPLIADFRVHGV